MACDPKLLAEIQKVIDTQIRPSLNMDGGDISIIGLEGNQLSVILHGACSCCPHAAETLKYGVERTLQQLVSPDIVVINQHHCC